MADDDYFQKMGKATQPIRDIFSKKPGATASAPPIAKAPEAPKPMTKSRELQGGVSYEDDAAIREAGEKAVKKLQPKSVMGKGSPKR